MTTADLDPDLVGGYASRRGRVDEMFGPDGSVRPHWDYVASSLAALGGDELETRRAEVRQLLRIDGATYHVYGDPAGLQRPWELDPVPSLVSSEEWAQVETGCAQRAELLNEVLIDLYGARDLIRRGLLPLDLVYEHPGFLRAVDGIRLPGDRQLVVYAVDLARGVDGTMTVMADRAQAPSGAGYALENRRVMSRVLPSMFRDAGVHRLALFFQTLRHRLRAVAPAGVDEPRVVILTPGSHNETYFEHAFLAAYLGYTLVEGGDLTVRDARVWLRSTTGLEPVDVILRRVDDWWSDPLELRPDSELGVAGLIEATRRGTVSVVNPLGSGVLENPALHAFLPAIAEHLLGHELDLPTVPTWWCGRPDHQAHVVANLERLVIKPVHRGPGVHPIFGGELSRAEVIEWRDRINTEPHRWVGQEPLTGSTVPALVDGRLEPERSVLRAFLVARDDVYVVMPGGLTRISGSGGAVTNQTGGSSKDTWVLASEPEKQMSMWLQPPPRVGGHDATGSLASRAAENLFWLGRHGERIEAAVRLLRTILGRLDVRLPGTDLPGSAGRTDGAAEGVRVLLEALTHVTGTQPGFLAVPSPAVERELLDVIFDGRRPGTVATNVRQLLAAAQPVRDLVGSDTFLVINGIEEEWDVVRSSRRGDLLAALTALVDLQQALLALVGVTGESMVRAPDWFFIDTGRRLERAILLLTLVRRTLVRARNDEEEASVAEGVLETAVSLITYRRRYRSYVQVDAVLDLLFADPANPRSLLYNVQRIEENLGHLPGHSLVRDQRLSRLAVLALEASTAIRLADTATLVVVDPATRSRPALGALIDHVDELLTVLGDSITADYFTHLQGRQLVTVSRMGRFGQRAVARFKVVHETRYDYVEPVSSCHNETHLTPRVTDRQRLLSHIIDIEPRPEDLAERVDFFGNRVRYFAVSHAHDSLVVTATSEVAVAPVDAELGLDAAASWEVSAKRTAVELDEHTLDARQYAFDSPLCAVVPSVTRDAAASFPPGRPTIDAVLDLTHRIYEDFAFDPGFTTLATPVAEVLEHRRGVCQDFAHVAIAALRGQGLAARYVSGYLETTPPDGRDRLVGVDASHVWASVYVPDVGWIDLDPTNDLVPSDRHITTAWGRDYSDVTPLKGIIYTTGAEQDLAVAVDVVRLD